MYVLVMLALHSGSLHFEQSYDTLTNCIEFGVKATLPHRGYRLACVPREFYEQDRKR